MVDSYQELREAELESERDLYYENRTVFRKKEPIVKHTSQIGELIWKLYPKAPQLVYVKANQLSQKMTEKGFQFWSIKERIQRIVEYTVKHNKPPIYLIGAFNRVIKEL